MAAAGSTLLGSPLSFDMEPIGKEQLDIWSWGSSSCGACYQSRESSRDSFYVCATEEFSGKSSFLRDLRSKKNGSSYVSCCTIRARL